MTCVKGLISVQGNRYNNYDPEPNLSYLRRVMLVLGRLAALNSVQGHRYNNYDPEPNLSPKGRVKVPIAGTLV